MCPQCVPVRRMRASVGAAWQAHHPYACQLACVRHVKQGDREVTQQMCKYIQTTCPSGRQTHSGVSGNELSRHRCLRNTPSVVCREVIALCTHTHMSSNQTAAIFVSEAGQPQVAGEGARKAPPCRRDKSTLSPRSQRDRMD